MVQLYTVNGGRPSARVPSRRYEAVRQAILAALADQPAGLGLWELCPACAPHLPQWWFDEGWDTPWHVTGVKLHLEHLGVLRRITGKGPHRVALAAVPAAPPA
jgi:hypothetical protein